MRIALCISGKIRHVKETWPGIHENLMKPNGITDVFVHTWNDKPGTNTGNPVQKYILKKDDERFIMDNYRPKILKVDSEGIIKNNPNYVETLPNSVFHGLFGFQCMYYSIKTANLLRSQWEQEKKIEYDLIVRTRFDVAVVEEMNLLDLDPDVLHAPNFVGTKDNGQLGDIFAVGGREVMDKYCKVWDNYVDYYNQGCKVHGETMCMWNAKAQGLDPEIHVWYGDKILLYHAMLDPRYRLGSIYDRYKKRFLE